MSSHPVRFGRYAVQRRLGAGAFATVYLAYDDQLDSPVAVKVLADNWSGDLHVRERFLAEGRLFRRVDSPHVVGVHDAGEATDGRPFLVLTYADAGTLVDQMQAGAPGSLGEAVEIVRQVGLGLSALHQLGIVHRDIKPANVLFRSSPDGVRAMVGDLGLGKVIDASSRLTQIGGTPAYAAAEQARGERVTAAADQYALGVVAYQLFEGCTPFSYDSLIAAQRPSSPRPMVAVNRSMAAVVLRALSAEPGERWPSVARFTEELVAATPSFGSDDPTIRLSAVSDRTLLASRFMGADGEPSRAMGPLNPSDSGAAPTGDPGPHGSQPVQGQPVQGQPGLGRAGWGARALAAAVGLVLLGAGGYAAGTRWSGEPDAPAGMQQVHDNQNRLAVSVPASWVDVVAGDGWTPPGGRKRLPALSVGSQAGWQQADSRASGVFLGMLSGGDVPDTLPGHPECAVTEATAIEADRRTAVYRKCPGGVVVEQVRQVDLHRYLWVQVRAEWEATATEVVDSVDLR